MILCLSVGLFVCLSVALDVATAGCNEAATQGVTDVFSVLKNFTLCKIYACGGSLLLAPINPPHLMVWKCVHGVAPAYLSDICVPATAISGHEHLRSAATGTLLVPHVRNPTG